MPSMPYPRTPTNGPTLPAIVAAYLAFVIAVVQQAQRPTGRHHVTYTQPRPGRGSFTSRPVCVADQAAADRHVESADFFAEAAAAVRTWTTEPCDGSCGRPRSVPNGEQAPTSTHQQAPGPRPALTIRRVPAHRLPDDMLATLDEAGVLRIADDADLDDELWAVQQAVAHLQGEPTVARPIRHLAAVPAGASA